MKSVTIHRSNQFNWILGLFVVMFMTILPAERSHAQLSAVAQAMEPEYFTRDLLIFIEGLDLDETQAVIAEAIFDDYEMQFDEGKLRMEQEIEALTNEIKEMKGQGQQDRILEMVVMPIQDWLVRREGLQRCEELQRRPSARALNAPRSRPACRSASTCTTPSSCSPSTCSTL